MASYGLTTWQWLPRPREEVFEFRHRALEQIFDAKSQARSGEITVA